MSHVEAEAAEAVRATDALVCNMGAIEDTGAMILAGKEANRLGIPVILDRLRQEGRAFAGKRQRDFKRSAFFCDTGKRIRNQEPGRRKCYWKRRGRSSSGCHHG